MTSHAQASETALELLKDQMLVHVGADDAAALLDQLPKDVGGLVLTGAKAPLVCQQLRLTYPDALLAVELRDPNDAPATSDRPFGLPDGEGTLFPAPTLVEMLDRQIEMGASIAVTPTGYVRAGDSDALRAVLDGVNELDRTDMVAFFPLNWSWLRDNPRQVAAVVTRCRHPAALAFGASKDPMAGGGAVEGLAYLIDEVGGPSLWRTDYAGPAVMGRGAHSWSFGFIPSLRHAVEPGKQGTAYFKADRRPYVAVPELMHIPHSATVSGWFANSKPWHCEIRDCDERPLDGYDGSEADRFAAHLHSVRALRDAHCAVVKGSTTEQRYEQFQKLVDAAVGMHTTLGTEIDQILSLPKTVARWSAVPLPVRSLS